jgi:hypothetical protein
MFPRTPFLVVVCLALTNCGWWGVGVETREPAYVEVTSAPVEIEAGPVIVYEGRPHYLYHDHWYYRDRGHWRYYRHEPSFLIEHRRRIHGPAHHEHRR